MMLSFGEYRPDVSDLRGQHTTTMANVVPRGDGYGPFNDFEEFTSALAAACRGYFFARKTDGSIAVFAGTATKLYLLDNTDLTWGDVSKAAGSYSAVPTSDQWQFAQHGNDVVAVQANTVPQIYTLGSSSAFADLGGSPPQARYVAVVLRFLVLSGLLSNPYRIRWSGLNDITEWTQATNQSDHQDFPDGGVVRGVAGGEIGIVMQDGAIRRMVYAPGSPTIFQIDRVAEDHGILAPLSLVRDGDRIFYLSSEGFYAITATGSPVAIGAERVNRTVLADLDTSNLQLMIGAADPRASRVFWAYKSIQGQTGLFDKIICYDHTLDRWSPPISINGEYLASLARPGITLENLDAISASIDALDFSLDDISTAAISSLSGVNSVHEVGFYSGDTLEATLETPEQVLDDRRVFVRGLRPITDAAAVYGSVKSRALLSATASESAETLINATGVCPQRVETRYARAKIRIPEATAWTFASGVEPDFVQAGRR